LEWLIVSGMCKGAAVLELKVFTCCSILSYFCPQPTALRSTCQLQASKLPPICCSDRSVR
jgi:hypothetical protein